MAPLKRILLLAVALWAGMPRVGFAHSLGLSFTGGERYRETELRGRLDLQKDWEAYGAYAELRLGEGDSVWMSRQILVGLEHSLSSALNAAGELYYEYDSSKVVTLGLGGKAYYTFYREGGAGGALSEDEALDRDIEAALSDSPGAGSGVIGGVFFGLDLRQFSIPGSPTSVSFTNPRGKVVTSSLRATYLTLQQLHPSLGLDFALWDGALRPSLTGGYYLYSQEDSTALRGLMLSSDSLAASRAGSLMSGLLRASWQAGLGLDLPWSMDLHADYGQQLLLNPEAWVDIYGLRISKEFLPHVRGEMGAQYSVLNGDEQWLGVLGVRVRF